MRWRGLNLFSGLWLGLISGSVVGAELVVQGVVTQWRPLVTFAQPGDVIRFKGMIGHDTETIEGMIPEGSTGWKSKLGEEGFAAVVEKDGIYIYKCNPHITTGMVGVIIVGDSRPPENLEHVEKSLSKIRVGRNMVKRALRKAAQAMESQQ